MLSFRAHELEVYGRHYILFPKLNRAQMRLMEKRFVKEGFSVRHGRFMTAVSEALTIHVEPLGLCWSSQDPSDVLLPMVPDLLGCKKESASPGRIIGMYFHVFPSAGGTVVKLFPRLEALGCWDGLRKSAGCGLAPDEHLVVNSLLSETQGTCPVITDFSVASSTPFCSGGRLYFRSMLPVSLVSDTLRMAETKGRENSYVPRDGLLRLERLAPSSWEKADYIEELGEWCSFVAAKQEHPKG